ncbi:hypothetical protein EC396_04470 [Lutibacter sp. HS1-25]|nr:hypothetical protein EC396_04470 [Lutibacter sp. HS1-25]
MERRKFIGLSAAAGTAIVSGPLLSFANLANKKAIKGYVPKTKNYMEVHKNSIVIDGAVPLLASTFNPKHIDWWIQGGATAISVTVGGANLGPDPTAKVIAWVAEQIQTRPELMLCRTANDIMTAKKEGKLGMFLHFQGPSAIGLDLDLVWFYKQVGVGVMQIAYNTRNPFANGATERVDGGLSTLGIGLVKACNSAKMIVDVSHTSKISQLDAIEASSEPVIISHGNAYGKIDNKRNVSDEVLKAIAANGGSAGVVGYPAFVSKNKQPSMDDMIGMIDYMVNLMGIDHVTCGLDYDGTTNGVMPAEKIQAQYDKLVSSGAWDPKAYPAPPYYYPVGIELPNTLYHLTDALLYRGYTKEDIGKIWGGNWLRVMDKVWGDPTAQLIDDGEDHNESLPHVHEH